MFKKLKDKLAEEVKSSPQRIQQFAQAAQAAVTSASSSISDITNSDLFSIGDNDGQQNRPIRNQTTSDQQIPFQDVPLMQSAMDSSHGQDYASAHDGTVAENPRQRRLSNSSFASDVSFRLPSYESPSMYHLQSDMEISASEAEEWSFSKSTVSLERVTKEQLYAAYRRTQERYTKYRTQYADLARHYKQLERENAKAKSVLVETQDKALRRISELREQCALEQSAKAHLEKALRVDIEERNMKIDTLNTKVALLQNNEQICNNVQKSDNVYNKNQTENEYQLINLSTNDETKQINEEPSVDINSVSNKIVKMEQLLNKYKESLKTAKEKNSQTIAELQILSSELENKNKEIEQLKVVESELSVAKQQIEELNINSEELQNKINAYDFSKTKEMSTMELDLQKARSEIAQLQTKIDIFSKKEEEYAISLAENKLSIHKELESKETEIKSLKDSLSTTKTELQSTNIIVRDYKNSISSLEEQLSKSVNDLTIAKSKITDMETQIQLLSQKSQSLEHTKIKIEEEYKCLELQMKQETAEKLAMIDRNVYLESRNTQLTEDNTKKCTQISNLENYMQDLKKDTEDNTSSFNDAEKSKMIEELDVWKKKYSNLECEIQEERDELVKLQSEIEKLLVNHELIQIENSKLHSIVKSKNAELEGNNSMIDNFKLSIAKQANDIKYIKESINNMGHEAKAYKNDINNVIIPEIYKSIGLFTDSQCALNTKCQELQKEYENTLLILDEANKQNDINLEEISNLQNNNEMLETKLQENQAEIHNLKKELKIYDNTYTEIKNENEKLYLNSLQYLEDKEVIQSKYQHLLNMSELSQKEQLNLTDKYTTTQKNLEEQIKNYKSNLEESQSQLTYLKTQQKDDESRLNQLQRDFDVKETHIKKLEEQLQSESQQNMTLKNQYENIAKNFRTLEVEIEELRAAHDKIETEKNHLNAVIEQLEKGQLEHRHGNINNKDTQTEPYSVLPDESSPTAIGDSHKEDEIVPKNFATLDQENKSSEDVRKMDYEIQSLIQEVNSLNSKKIELEQKIKDLNEINIQMSNKLLEKNCSNIDQIDNTEKYQTTQNDYDSLKEENRRLQSDVEGLQTYLTKISKENGILNDKIRELIASEIAADKNEQESDCMTELKNEVRQGKEKIDDLLRENSFLLEENLELKDQLESQVYVKPSNNASHKDTEFAAMNEKYVNILEAKKKLEDHLLNTEQMNTTVNKNMQELQVNNEKLKLTNEKLERRLDEALVSLRHLHSLQENTELEYLRNILYEYLTGSGTHSITLAKVLAAVVKFDDRQTQQVLQKEKERQGLLRQLGLT